MAGYQGGAVLKIVDVEPLSSTASFTTSQQYVAVFVVPL
jgi:hypothetical protein